MSKTQVAISPQIDQTVDRVAQAVSQAAPEGPIFRRAGTLVRPSDDYRSVVTWAPQALRVQVSRYCTFIDNNRLVAPPNWLPKALLENPPNSLPALEAISRTPLLLSDGTQIGQGYHRASGTLVRSSVPTEAPANPLEVLLEPYAEFPFEKDRDRAALLAAIMTVYCRHLIEGPVPSFAINAPRPGTGKSLLAKLVGYQTTGALVESTIPVKGEEEMRKRLMSIALKAPQIVLLDNVIDGLESEALCSAITSGVISDRMLGSTQMVEASFRSVWLITGNNLEVLGDMRRRTLYVNLDARTEEPQSRKFKVDENVLPQRTADNAPTSAAAAHALIKQFWAANSPQHTGDKLGSFGEWDALVRSLVVWALKVDPCASIRQTQEEKLLSKWRREFGKKSISAAKVYGYLSDSLPPQALESVAATGRYLAQVKGVEKGPRTSSAQTWRLKR